MNRTVFQRRLEPSYSSFADCPTFGSVATRDKGWDTFGRNTSASICKSIIFPRRKVTIVITNNLNNSNISSSSMKRKLCGSISYLAPST